MSAGTPPKAPALDERVLVFESGGSRLVGILTEPARRDPALPGALLLSPGLKHRVGPHRLHLKLARLFAELGMPVFRFDFHGTGDAEGELPGDLVSELHERIQLGHFTGDGSAALDAFCAEAGVDRVLACGLCGGAITGVFLAEADPRVEAIVGFQLPVKVLGLELDFADRINTGFSIRIFVMYLKKLTQLSAWKNFLTGKSEYGLILKTGWRTLKSKLGVEGGPRRGEIPPLMNRPFLAAYDAIRDRTAMVWIYSEFERARFDFDEEFEQACLAGEPQPYEKAVIVESNHEFAPDAAQARLFELIADWVRRRYREGRERAS
jgi:hypothetical protein